MTTLRSALTKLAATKGESGNPYLITAAVGAGPAGYTYMKVAQMNAAMDYWNLMVCLISCDILPKDRSVFWI